MLGVFINDILKMIIGFEYLIVNIFVIVEVWGRFGVFIMIKLMF